MRPLIVVEGRDEEWVHAVHQVRAVGWPVSSGLCDHAAFPVTGCSGVVCSAVVSDSAGAARAVLAGVAGHGLVVLAGAGRDVNDRLCDDLRHLGELDHRVGVRRTPVLTAEQHALLDGLRAGEQIGTLAERLFLSRRSVERRLALLRELFAVDGNVALAAAYGTQLAEVPVPGPDQPGRGVAFP
ncbi:hypothetical protein [Nocardioides daejeonensis]|uniref:hypothetical protein n=1 Tax=Nocardioides daejeonensis TaxID=1046556 RepID=UPI000D742D45|nr:hypothetical protein [Nocardioides daejeonensis]